MELHNAIPLPDNSIHEKKNSTRVPQEKCTFKEHDAEKKEIYFRTRVFQLYMTGQKTRTL